MMGARVCQTAFAAVAMCMASFAAISPLASAKDYRFSVPAHPDMVRGTVMGAAGKGASALRGEDPIYLYEALAEMEGVSSASASTEFGAWPGIDERRLRGSTSRVGTAYARMYDLLSSSASSGALVLSGREVDVRTNAWPIALYGLARTSTCARDAVLFSGASRGVTDGMAALGERAVASVLAAADVAAYYSALADVGGVANDYALTSRGTNSNATTQRTVADSCVFNVEEGAFAYSAGTPVDAKGSRVGGGMYEYTIQDTFVEQRQSGSNTLRSRAMHSSVIGSFCADDEVEAVLWTNAFARAANLSCRKAWVVAVAQYVDTLTERTSPTNEIWSYCQTNVVVALPCEAKFFERDGMVVAKATPHYDDAYNMAFAVLPEAHRPDDGWYPAAPVASAFPVGNETVKNRRSTSFDVTPERIALVVDVDWHTGFHRIEASRE